MIGSCYFCSPGFSSPHGPTRMRWSGCEVHHMTIDVIIFIILCFALFLFLLYALLNPEKF